MNLTTMPTLGTTESGGEIKMRRTLPAIVGAVPRNSPARPAQQLGLRPARPRRVHVYRKEFA